MPILAGSDAGNPFTMPGESLLRELVLLENVAYSAREVLFAATLGAARFLGLEDSGRIRPGYVADLVLLERNPLEDIGAVESVAGVVRAGKWIEIR